MEKRYQVFVSSTYDDLKEERALIIEALLNINCIPCGMEYFPAGNEEAWHCIQRLIRQCDYYIVIIAGKYGSSPKGQKKSYTQLEYELAIESGVPVLGLIHKDPQKLPQKDCETDKGRSALLEKFRSIVKRRLCRFWDDPQQLPGELLASLTQQMQNFPRVGWVRGDAIASDEAKSEIIILQRKLAKAESDIARLRDSVRKSEDQLADGREIVLLTGHLDLELESDDWDTVLKWRRWDVKLVATWDAFVVLLKNNRSRSTSEREFGSSMSQLFDDQIKAFLKAGSHLFANQPYRLELDHESWEMMCIQYEAMGLLERSADSILETKKMGGYVAKCLAVRRGGKRPDARNAIRLELPELDSYYDFDEMRF